MHKFASGTKNVHKELKESLANAAKVLNHYMKVKGIEAAKNKETVPLERDKENTNDSHLSIEYLKKIQTDLENI